jgi:hypothetical protein
MWIFALQLYYFCQKKKNQGSSLLFQNMKMVFKNYHSKSHVVHFSSLKKENSLHLQTLLGYLKIKLISVLIILVSCQHLASII